MLNSKIKDYHIQSELGRGGMATVFLAHDNKFDTHVAIKVLNKEFVHNDNIRKRFLAEARNMFKMSHPNIVKVTDLIDDGDIVAFVMEYVEGETLKEYLDIKGKLGDKEIKDLFSQMLDAVSYVHEQNLVHRDIKPSNFMVDKKGKIKLMDFGIAKNTDASAAEYTQTGTGMQMGTPMYMSPEQIKSAKQVNLTSDIYSLGVVLWQMISGKKPYDQNELSMPEIQVSIIKEPLPNLNSVWDRIIKKATAKDCLKRYQYAGEFLQDLINYNISNRKSNEETIFEENKFHRVDYIKHRSSNLKKNYSHMIGIDLGNSYSCVAVFDGHQPVVIPGKDGDRLTPTAVGYVNGVSRMIGKAAKDQAISNPTNTLYSIYRFLGSSFVEIQHELDRLPYSVENNENGGIQFIVENKKVTPEEVAACFLAKLKQDAEEFLGYIVTEAVIVVPVSFNMLQRQAIFESAKMAGIKVINIISNAASVAFAYGFIKRRINKKIAVIDFGGGNFTCTIFEIEDGVIEILSTKADSRLSGDAFDLKIVEWIDDQFKYHHGALLNKDAPTIQRLRNAAETAKIELSSSQETEINLPFMSDVNGNQKHLVVNLNLKTFNQITQSIIDQSLQVCLESLQIADLSKNDIGEIVMVGGTTRVTAVQKAFEIFFGKKLNRNVNPDEVVALGAAVRAGILSYDIQDLLLLDTIPYSLGIERAGNSFEKLIESNSIIPIKRTLHFTTAFDNQSSIEIHILQGDSTQAKQNLSIGRLILDGIQPSPAGKPKIEVTFDLNTLEKLIVSAKDLTSGTERTVIVDGSLKRHQTWFSSKILPA